MKLTTPALLAKNYRRQVFIYGMAGVGKTTLVASATKPLLLEVDPGGADSLLSTPYRNIPVVKINGEKEFKDIVNELCTPAEIGNERIQTIILDTISVLQKFDLTDQRAAVGRQVSMNEFNQSNIHMVDPVIKLLRHCGKHVIIVGHEKEIRAENGSIIGYTPQIQPGTLQAMRQLMSGVFFYRDKSTPTQTIRELCVAHKESTGETKFRIPLPPKFVNPTWKDVEAAYDDFYSKFLPKEEVKDEANV